MEREGGGEKTEREIILKNGPVVSSLTFDKSELDLTLILRVLLKIHRYV